MISPLANLWGQPYIPETTSIGAFCDIGPVVFGENCKVQCHVSIPPGWVIGENVFIGPGVRFANDRHPDLTKEFFPEIGTVEDDVVIGMGALILPVRIGKGATIGAGAVVTKDVPPAETWVGNPARPLDKK